MRKVVVVLAGGVGTRVGLDLPKQLVRIAGRTVLEHTLSVVGEHPEVEEVIVMMTPGHLDAVHAILGPDGRHHPKVTRVLPGADTRNGTTRRALDALGEEDCHVLFHDAVRPLLSPAVIDRCFEALAEHDAVDVAIPSADTVIEVDEDDFIVDVPRRDRLRRGQTPQGFRASVLRRAYDLAEADPDFTATDDCTVVLRYTPDIPIKVVAGEERNMKITDPIDLFLVDKLFQLAAVTGGAGRTDAQYDEALAGRVVVVFGGSYGIGRSVADLAQRHGAHVHVFSRSGTGTHVERREDVRRAVQEVLVAHGRVDHVVNSAGVLPRQPLVETSEEEVFAATEVNYLGPVYVAQESHAALRESGGSLLLFTSSSYTRGRSGYSLYSSAKAATVNLTQALADEWADDGIRVNCVNPERTGTPMRTQAFGAEDASSLLSSEEVARVCIETMISPASGQVLDVRRDDPFGKPGQAR